MRQCGRTFLYMPTGIPYVVNDDDRSTVINGLKFNQPLATIAAEIGVSVPTIEAHYAAEIAAAELKRGRKPFEATDAQRKLVWSAAGLGLPHSQIAALLEISEGTLRTYFRKELDQGAANATMKVAGALFRIATADPPLPTSATAGIFWMKTRAGWKETSRVENTGADGNPIEVESSSSPVMLLLPDNGRGDCNLPVYRGPRSDQDAANDSSSPGEDEPPWKMKA